MNPRFRNTAIVGILVSAIALVASANAVETFAVGTAASSVDLRQAAGAMPLQNGWAIPLRGARPDWYTPALQRAVFMAAGKPVAAPLDAPLPSEFGIRPGAWMIEPAGCTMNFIFANDTKKGIGTAGHCVDRVGQHVVLLTLAPASGNPVLVDIGAVIARRNAVSAMISPWWRSARNCRDRRPSSITVMARQSAPAAPRAPEWR